MALYTYVVVFTMSVFGDGAQCQAFLALPTSTKQMSTGPPASHGIVLDTIRVPFENRLAISRIKVCVKPIFDQGAKRVTRHGFRETGKKVDMEFV